MVKNNNTIEINGKHYNVETGEIVANSSGSSSISAKKANATITTRVKHTPKKSPSSSKKTKSVAGAPQSKAELKHTLQIKPDIQAVKPRPVAPIIGHTPQAPKTLMRKGVQKPTSMFHQRLKAQSPTDVFFKQPPVVVPPKLSVESVNNKRLNHARVIAKSQLISHYTTIDPSVPSTPQLRSHVPIAAQPPRFYRRVPLRPQAPLTTEQLLQRALERATSHEQPPYKPVRTFHSQHQRHIRRAIGVGGASLVCALLIGFVVHMNMSNIKLQLASSKAGFVAAVPANQPADTHLGSLSSSIGIVTLKFTGSGAAPSNYVLTEQASTWDSDTLRAMYLNQVAKHFQIIEAAGNTIYIYGQQNATWVSGNVWYQIQSHGSLSNQQLISIASSL